MIPQKLTARAAFGTDLHTVISSMMTDSGQAFGYTSPCGGAGTCGKCRIRIISGEVSPMGPQEEQHLSEDDIIAGIRLACYATAEGDLTIAEAAEQRIMEVETGFSGESEDHLQGRLVESFRVMMSVPTFDDNRDGALRVIEALSDQCGIAVADVSPVVLHQLPVMMRHLMDMKQPAGIWAHICDGTVISVCPAEGVERFYGIAVDIGTTTVACYLVDLSSGEIIDTESALNAQHIAGADVIARIGYTLMKAKGSEELARVITEQLQDMILELCGRNGIMTGQVTSCAVAGNTTMLHLLLGIDAGSISRVPFNPVFTSSQIIRDLFSELEGCSVYLLPSASGYIGADIVGGGAAVHLDTADECSLFVDIGTNGEIVLKSPAGLFACSTAAGPAFEGANLSCGSGGVSGAIDSVSYDGEVLRFTTIHDQAPAAVCGSGVLDVAALLVREGLVDRKGRFARGEHVLASRMAEVKGKPAFTISGETVYLSQADIREIQLAKSAIRTGIEALLDEAGITADKVSRLYIAGGFGSRIRISSAAEIGLIPPQLADRVVCVGNTSGRSAVSALLSGEFRDRCETMRNEMRIIDLSGRKGFSRDLAMNMYFEGAANE